MKKQFILLFSMIACGSLLLASQEGDLGIGKAKRFLALPPGKFSLGEKLVKPDDAIFLGGEKNQFTVEEVKDLAAMQNSKERDLGCQEEWQKTGSGKFVKAAVKGGVTGFIFAAAVLLAKSL